MTNRLYPPAGETWNVRDRERGPIAEMRRDLIESFDAMEATPLMTPDQGMFYVSPSGDDNNNGSQAYPVATINKAIEFVAEYQDGNPSKPGIVEVGTGDYIAQTIVLEDSRLASIQIRGPLIGPENARVGGIRSKVDNELLQNLVFRGFRIYGDVELECPLDGEGNLFGSQGVQFYDSYIMPDYEITATAINFLSFFRTRTPSFTAKNLYALAFDKDCEQWGSEVFNFYRDGNSPIPNYLSIVGYQQIVANTSLSYANNTIKTINDTDRVIKFNVKGFTTATSMELGVAVECVIYEGGYIYAATLVNNGKITVWGGQLYDPSSLSGTGTIEYDAYLCGSAAIGPQFMITAEGGYAVRLINKTGVASVKGTVVDAGSVDDSFIASSAGGEKIVGVVYQNGIADGDPCFVVVSGKADVLLEDSTSATAGNWVKTSGSVAGRADATNVSPIPAEHWREVGHCIQTKTGSTDVLARSLLHFN